MNTFDREIRAGVIGAGRLGREHARIYASTAGVALAAVYDRIESRAADTAGGYGAKVCATIDEVLGCCDAVSICTPATNHHETASQAFESGVHALVEKPISSNSSDGESMLRKADAAGCILQVGHIERFNGGFQAAASVLRAPRFIESHRLATFSPRGTDVSVVVDLMIHDIDLVLSVLRGDEIVDLRASGARVLTSSPDIVNARIEFKGGCVANMTASRISREPLRKIRFFEENLYVSADLRAKQVEAYQKRVGAGFETSASDPTSFIQKIPLEVDQDEPLRKEISSFMECIRSGKAPHVSGREALDALIVAERVLSETGVDGGRR